MPKGKLQPQPEVKLINYFEKPYENVVATARTCYSEKPVYPWDVLKTEKSAKIGKKIFRSVFEAGHHTTFQHPTFQFLISNVSREFVWSFLHSHPFYNSEQVSQRYVEVKPENFVQPIMQEKHAKIYKDTIKIQMDTYLKLTNLIKDKVEECYFEIFPSRKKDQKRWQSTIHRKALEFARYILPVATHTFLYHTISGLTLYRYWYLCQMYDVSYETQSVVSKMVKEVKKIDAKFFENIKDPIPIEQTPEFYLVCNLCKTKVTDSKFIEEFDQRLEGKNSKIIDYKINAEGTLACAVRSVLGLSEQNLSDKEAISILLDPAKNTYLSGTLNLTTLSKISRAMFHPHFTFQKKISHSADSQNQRHRMTPASRPILFRHFNPTRPDYILPPIINQHAQARDCFEQTINKIWNSIDMLLNDKVEVEFALYLLPNAFPIRLIESGDLLNLFHKWKTRLCFLSQEEIWRCSLEEVLQLKMFFPELTRHIKPVCALRKASGIVPYCPEGERFCGLPVWNYQLEDYKRTI